MVIDQLEENIHRGKWKITCHDEAEWLSIRKVMEQAYPRFYEAKSDIQILNPFAWKLADWYACRERHYGTASISYFVHTIIFKNDEQLTYFNLMKDQIDAF